MNKLNFQPEIMNGQEVLLAEPYKVVHYDWSEFNGSVIEKPHWSAYYRIYDNHSKSMLFGDAVEHVSMYKSKEYATKKEAIAACQKHLDNTLK